MQSRLGRTNQVLAVTNPESPNLRFHHGWHHLRFHAGTSVLRARLERMELQAQRARLETMDLQAHPALQARQEASALGARLETSALRARLERMELQANPALQVHAETWALRARLEWMELQAQWARLELMELQARPALQALRARLDWTELQGSPALQVLRARLELMELQALVLLWMRWRYESHFLRDLSWHHCLQTSTRSPFWVRVLGRSRVPPRLAQRQVRIPRMAHFRCPDVRGFASRMYQYILFPRIEFQLACLIPASSATCYYVDTLCELVMQTAFIFYFASTACAQLFPLRGLVLLQAKTTTSPT